MIKLSTPNLQADIHPQIGAAVSRFSWRGIDILRATPTSAIEAGTVRQMAIYALVPYSNRIGNGKLVVRDKTYQLRANFPGEPHAIHGIGFRRAWEIEREEKDVAQLVLRHQPDEDWPFKCEVQQEFRLHRDTLSIRLRVTNLDDQPMPTGLGFHPFFPLNGAPTLQAEWNGMWEMGEDKLPTRLVGVTPETDFSKPRVIGNWQIDNCFTDWKRRAILEYPDRRVTLIASAACTNIVCFAPNDGRNFIALEPVTNINNGFALAAKGVADTGVRTLGRGDALEITMSITVSAPRSEGASK